MFTSGAAGFGKALFAWLRNWTQPGQTRAELEYCGPEATNIAHDIGMTPGEFRVVAAKRPDSADLLYQRLTTLHLDREAIAHNQGAVMRDLQRACTICGAKRRCARDLAEHASSEWQTYCPNTPTLTALQTEAADKEAVRRLERRAARFGRTN